MKRITKGNNRDRQMLDFYLTSHSHAACGERFGMTRQGARQALEKLPGYIAPRELKAQKEVDLESKIRRLAEQGFSCIEIASKLNLSDYKLRQMLSELRIEIVDKRGDRLIDLTGQVFGDWTVLDFSGRGKGATHWRCRCKCGNIRVVSSSNLRKGRSKSCASCGAKKRYQTIGSD